MSAATTVPVKVMPEAADRIAELGLHAEYERILEKIREVVPDLRRIEVLLAQGYEPDEEDKIDLLAFTAPQDVRVDRKIYDQFNSWMVTSFPANVGTYFLFTMLDEAPHAG